jgi:hypothetical protein
LCAAIARKYSWIRGTVLTLFYISIFAACVVSALVFAWLFRLITNVGSKAIRTIRPGSDNGPTSHLHVFPDSILDKERVASISRTRALRSTDDARTGGDSSYFGPRNDYSAPLHAKVQLNSAGWINREDRQTSGGRTYKVNRRVKVREQNPTYVNKPASW